MKVIAASIQIRWDQDCSHFERELAEHRPPTAEIAAIPPRLIV